LVNLVAKSTKIKMILTDNFDIKWAETQAR